MALTTEKVTLILQQYERRCESARRWSKTYYDRNANQVKIKRLLSGVRQGRLPKKTTIERLGIDRHALRDAFLSYVNVQQEGLTERAKEFQKVLESL